MRDGPWWCLLPIDFPATSSPRLTTSPMSTTSGVAMRLSVHELCAFGFCHVALFRLQISAVEPASRVGAFERAASIPGLRQHGNILTSHASHQFYTLCSHSCPGWPVNRASFDTISRYSYFCRR